jgi:thermitase
VFFLTEPRLIVGFHPYVSKNERIALHRNMGGTLIQEIDELNAHVVTVPALSHQAIVAQYSTNPIVRYIELDQKYQAVGPCKIIPNDPNYNLQWGLEKIMAPEAWCRALRTPAGVIIAILDTGVDQTHPDLAGKVTLAVNFTDSPNPDFVGHGTHVSGIAGANTNNLLFGAGVSFNS